MLVHNSERFGCRRAHRRPIKQRYPAPERYLLGERRDLQEVAIAFRKLFPDTVETRIHRADLICAHVFDLLGSGPTGLSPPGPSYTDYGKFLRGTDSVILRRSRRIWPPDETFLPFVTQILHGAALRSEPALSVAEGMTHGAQEFFLIRLISP